MNDIPLDQQKSTSSESSAEPATDRIPDIKSWDELFKLPRLATEIDKTNLKELAQIVGQYEMFDKQRRPCSIHSCHHKHFKGRIIRFQDGQLSFIGKDCGARIFGADWTRVEKAFSEVVKREQRILLFKKIQSDAHLMLAEIEKRQGRLARFERSMESLGRAVNERIIDGLGTRAFHDESDITVEQRLSEEEKEYARATGTNVRSQTIVLGALRGLRIFRTGMNPHSIANALRTACQRILSCPDAFSERFRIALSDAPSLQVSLNKLDSCFASSDRFFQHDNLQLLMKLPHARETRLTWIRIAQDGTVTAAGF